MSNELTVQSLMELWKKELFPMIQSEIATQVSETKGNIETITERLKGIEASQEFLASRYDEVIEGLKQAKKQISSAENKIKDQKEAVRNNKDSIDDLHTQLDELQQYSRRECLEISGIPKLENDQPVTLLKEMANNIGVTIADSDISVAHRLPDTKTTKNRMIVKFVQRDKKEELYSKRSKLRAFNCDRLPTVQAAGVRCKDRVFINESLTPYRKQLLRRINDYKKENVYKFVWTRNGKIFLKKNEASRAHGFSTEEDFNKFLADQ